MNDRLTSIAQIAISLLFLTGYFVVIILFMMGYANIPTDYKEAFSGLLSLMTGGGLTVLYFWFQRTRVQSSDREPPPDPNPNGNQP